LGRKDIEDALKNLNNLIQKEVPMAIAQTMMGRRPTAPDRASYSLYAELLSAQMSTK
jgi:hypothetical protein